MATILKKFGKWQVSIRRSFHKPIYKTFISKQDAQRWGRETERLIEIGSYQDLSEANKTTLKQLLERYEREVSSKKGTTTDKYLIRNILTHDFVNKPLSHVSSSDVAEFRDARLNTISTRHHSKVSGSSVNRELSILSDCINRAIKEWGCYIRENPVKTGLRSKENDRRIRRLENGEYIKLKSSTLISNQTLDEILQRKIQFIGYDLDQDFNFLTRIKDINSEDILKVTRKYLSKPFLSIYGGKKICNEIKKIWIKDF